MVELEYLKINGHQRIKDSRVKSQLTDVVIIIIYAKLLKLNTKNFQK